VRASGDSGGRNGWWSWNSRLWVLAAALGAATILSTGTIFHNSRQRRAVLRQLAGIAAQQVVERAAARLDLLAAQLPGAPASFDSAGPRVSDWFRLDVATSRLQRTPAAIPSTSALLPSSLLAELARAAASRPGPRLVMAPELGQYAVVTATRRGPRGEPPVVDGLVGDTRAILAALFGSSLAERADDSVSRLARLDTLSLQIATAAGVPLFGRLGADRAFRATALPRGALEGLAVTVALAPDQVPPRLLLLTSRTQLWHNGLLLLSTLLVIGFAVGASRRELLLARARSNFIAGVSHDLRMPLAQILIAGETLTLRRERNEADRHTLTSSIVRETQRLIALVDNVLLFSRSGAVPERPRLEPLSVPSLFGEVVTAVQLSAEDAEQTVEVVTSTDLAVLGDRRLLRQALVNLVDNALKYGSRGQRIRLAAAPGPPGWVRLQVADEGPGVPADQRIRVFEPYERLGRDQASERTGSGLGLAVVRHIVRACEGQVWLEEAPGGGTLAVLELRAPEPA